MVRNKAVDLAIGGVNCAGTKEILGLWIEQTEDAKFWMRVVTEIRSCGTTAIVHRAGGVTCRPLRKVPSAKMPDSRPTWGSKHRRSRQPTVPPNTRR